MVWNQLYFGQDIVIIVLFSAHKVKEYGPSRYSVTGTEPERNRGRIMSMLQRRSPDDRVQILDESGTVVEGATVPDLRDETFVAMYRDMRLMRRFDERAVNLQRQGRLGTFPPLAGQEGAQVGSGYATDEDDWSFTSYREHAFNYIQGVELGTMLKYWAGDERGNYRGGSNVFPIAVPIATQIPHATGAAWAATLQGDRIAVVCHFGYGATSEGDFHEGLNFAGVFDLPTVFICHNNQYAISVPRERQTASETLAQKAHAYGFDGVQVDGMDPLAVYQVTRNAVERAKDEDSDGLRPTLIEAIQYRYGAHTTADDPSTYRDEAEVEAWREKDPIDRFEAFLLDRGMLDEERIDAITGEIESEIEDAVAQAEEMPPPDPTEMFEHVYEEPTAALREQQAHLENLREKYGDDEVIE